MGAIRTARLIAAVLAAAMTWPTAAVAARHWSGPTQVAAEASSTRVASGSDGDSTAAWTTSDGGVYAREHVPGSGWGATAQISGAGEAVVSVSVAAGEGHAALVTWRSEAGALYASIRSVEGTWSAPTRLAREGATEATAAMNSAGLAAVLWARTKGKQTAVQAVVAEASRWGHASTLASESVSPTNSVLAVDERGDVLAFWHGDHGTTSVVRPAASQAWGPALVEPDLSGLLAVRPNGEAMLISERDEEETEYMESFTKTPNGTWSPPTVIASGPDFSPVVNYNPIKPIALAITPSGRAVLQYHVLFGPPSEGDNYLTYHQPHGGWSTPRYTGHSYYHSGGRVTGFGIDKRGDVIDLVDSLPLGNPQWTRYFARRIPFHGEASSAEFQPPPCIPASEVECEPNSVGIPALAVARDGDVVTTWLYTHGSQTELQGAVYE